MWGIACTELFPVFQQITNSAFKIFAELINNLKIYPLGLFVIEKGNRIPVNTDVPGDIGNLQLPLSH